MSDAPGDDRTRLLYVDDDEAAGKLVSRALARTGRYTVELALSGREALERAKDGGWDAMALDLFMPEMDGMQTLAELQRRLGASLPPVVMVTAAEDAHSALQAMRAGAADYVVKDVGGAFLELLPLTIEQALSRSRADAARRAAESELVAALGRGEALARHRELLLAELNHRVGNSMQLITALVRMHARNVTNPEATEVLGQLERRILALARLNQRLGVARPHMQIGAGGVPLAAYLKDLVGDLAEGAGSAGAEIAFASDVKADAPHDKAISVGMIVTELVTNALKYAYPDTAQGPIHVGLKDCGDEGMVELRVEDQGVGVDAAAPTRGSGLGSRIVTAMARGLRATEMPDDRREPRVGVLRRLQFQLS